MKFWLTTDDVDDRRPVLQLVDDLKGWLFGNKRYMEYFFGRLDNVF